MKLFKRSTSDDTTPLLTDRELQERRAIEAREVVKRVAADDHLALERAAKTIFRPGSGRRS